MPYSINSVSFDCGIRVRDAVGSDLHVSTWADDGYPYEAWGDGYGFARVVKDPFTDVDGTAIDAHTEPVSGLTWQVQPGSGTGRPIITGNVLTSGPTATNNHGTYYVAAATAGPMAARFTLHVNDASVNSFDAWTDVALRCSATAETYYACGYEFTNQQWRIAKIVGGTNTSLATSNAVLTAGQDYQVEAIVEDDASGNARLQLYVNGSLMLEYTDTTPIAAGGYPGLSTGQAGTPDLQWTIDNFSADPPSGYYSYGFTKHSATPGTLDPTNISYGPSGSGNGKVSGIICIAGTFYFTFYDQLGDGSHQHSLRKSTDHCATVGASIFTWPKAVGPAYLVPGQFVQMGQDFAGSPDGYVYCIAGVWGDTTPVYLMRVPKASIETESAWEVFSGTSSAPAWDTNFNNAAAVFSGTSTYGNVVDTCIHYFPDIQKYVLFYLTSGTTTYQFQMYASDNVYGPWTLVGDYSSAWCSDSEDSAGPLIHQPMAGWSTWNSGTNILDFWLAWSGSAPVGNYGADSLNLRSAALSVSFVPGGGGGGGSGGDLRSLIGSSDDIAVCSPSI